MLTHADHELFEPSLEKEARPELYGLLVEQLQIRRWLVGGLIW